VLRVLRVEADMQFAPCSTGLWQPVFLMQTTDTRTRKVHPKSDQSNAGTEHFKKTKTSFANAAWPL
jgi:hypothetical protein